MTQDYHCKLCVNCATPLFVAGVMVMKLIFIYSIFWLIIKQYIQSLHANMCISHLHHFIQMGFWGFGEIGRAHV